MTLQQQTRSKIYALAKAIISGQRNETSAMQGGYAVIVTPKYDPERLDDLCGGLSLFGETAKLYQEIQSALANDSAVEHLTPAVLRDALAAFAASLDTKREHIGSRARREQIEHFISSIAKPHAQYEIAFSIDGVHFDDDDTLTIGDVEFRKFTTDFAANWGYEPVNEQSSPQFGDIIDESVGIIRVEAGTREKALDHGEESLDHALNALRTAIGLFRPSLIYDSQLRQRRGTLRVVKQLEPEIQVWPGWKGTREALDMALSGSLLDSTRDFAERLRPVYDNCIDNKLRDALRRSLEWIGTSITTGNYDHKVVDLCTALESILTTIADSRKGEAVALRVMLLSIALGERFRHPGQIHRLYELRSRIVHGAALGECGRSDYEALRAIAGEAILNVISLNSAQGPFSRPFDVIKYLETPDRLEQAASWLEQSTDDSMVEVAVYAREKCTQ